MPLTVSASPAREGFDWTATTIAIIVAAIGVGSIFQPAAIPHDVEELYNAAHARLIQLEHADKWLTLQYRSHCGGCTHNALIGSVLFAAFGPSLFVWKLVPVMFLGLLAYAGSSLLRRHNGPPAAWAFGILLVFVPPTFLELSMTSWGNHFESGVAAVVCLAATLAFQAQPSGRRAMALGLILAWALWIGFSSVFVVGGIAWILRKHLWTRRGAVAALALSSVGLIWMVQAIQTPSSVFDTIYQPGEALPKLTRVPLKIWSLVAPRQLVALFGWKSAPWGWLAGWLVVASGICAAWINRNSRAQRATGALLIAYLAIYSVVRFTVWAPPAPEIAPPGSMRYAAPVYGLWFLLLAGGIGHAWRHRRRALAIALLLPSVTVGLAARAAVMAEQPDSASSVFSMAAADFEYARDQLAYLFSLEEHAECDTPALDARDFHSFGSGWAQTKRLLDANPGALIATPTPNNRAAMEGVGSALLSHLDGSESATLALTHDLLARSAQLDVNAQRILIAASGFRRAWTESRTGHGAAAIADWALRIEALHPTVQEGLTVAFGRKWAHATTRWRSRESVVLPDPAALALPLQSFFWEGYAEGLGERIGPEARSLSAPVDPETWSRGVEFGLRRRWLSRSR